MHPRVQLLPSSRNQNAARPHFQESRNQPPLPLSVHAIGGRDCRTFLILKNNDAEETQPYIRSSGTPDPRVSISISTPPIRGATKLKSPTAIALMTKPRMP